MIELDGLEPDGVVITGDELFYEFLSLSDDDEYGIIVRVKTWPGDITPRIDFAGLDDGCIHLDDAVRFSEVLGRALAVLGANQPPVPA